MIPNWKLFHFLADVICGTLKAVGGGGGGKQVLRVPIKEFLCVLLNLT